MNSSPRGADVTALLAGLSSPWPRESASTIVAMVRRPGVTEESIKWGNPFFSVRGHAVVKIFVAHDWINVYFYRGRDLPDPQGLLESTGNGRMRKLRIGRGDPIPVGVHALMDAAVEALHIQGT